MSGDIVQRLRYYDEYNDHAPPSFCGRVADHIATLTADLAAERAEVERLRAAGDALAAALRRHQMACGVNDASTAVAAWQKACRER